MLLHSTQGFESSEGAFTNLVPMTAGKGNEKIAMTNTLEREISPSCG
jgi:hypothetical protein